MLKKIFLFIILFLGLLSVVLGIGTYWGYRYITRDLPNFEKIEDYKPPAVTKVYANDGTLIAEFYKEKRYPVKFSQIPDMIRKCFLAAEDINFYSHPGIDPISILRAVVRNFQSGHASQGASTITQQVVKNLLLTPERNYKRKIKEAILSYRLEKRLTKDGIFEIYLNQIFFGNSAYGIKSAAQIYFHKDLENLTLAEGAYLAALPKAPSRYSPVSNYNRAKRRQKYVLNQMIKAGFVTEQDAANAFREEVKVYPAYHKNVYHSPYFATEIRNVFRDKWPNLDLDVDGLTVSITADLKADKIAQESLQRGLKLVDKRRGWRGVLEHIQNADKTEYLEKYKQKLGEEKDDGTYSYPEHFEDLTEETVYPAMVTGIKRAEGVVSVIVGHGERNIDLTKSTWARKFLGKQDKSFYGKAEDVLKKGDIIEVSVKSEKALDDEKLALELTTQDEENLKKEKVEAVKRELYLDQTPDIEGGIVLIDPNSGRVVAMSGGYDYGRSQFNRATQSHRQPGSAFKPIVYLAAVDGFKYTPSTIVYDTPRTFRAGDQYWTPQNFDEKYLGAITLQTALEKSRNLVSTDIVSKIGLNAPIEYAKKLGIASPLGKNLSLSLGTSEVTMLELTRAYGVFAARGILFNSTFVEKIEDRDGKILYNYEQEKLANAKQVIDEKSAFIMAHMMKGTVERGTATAVKALGRPVAGKTGTTNDYMDTWFIGFTPKWVCGVWVGFDLKKEIGEKETGGKISAPMFLDFMKRFLDYQENKEYEQLVADSRAEAEKLGIQFVNPQKLPPIDFTVPVGIDPYWVNKYSGLISSQDAKDAILEYFIKGTEPGKAPTNEEEENNSESYLDSPDL
jgi:penicillin-binding protein 1A